MNLGMRLIKDIEKTVLKKLAALGNPVGGSSTKAAPVKVSNKPNMSKTLNNEVSTGITAQTMGIPMAQKIDSSNQNALAANATNPFTVVPMTQLT